MSLYFNIHRVIEQDGCSVVCDAMSYEFLKGAKIEFEETMMRSSFVIGKNPNAEASCGCGSSFSPKSK